MACLDHFDTHLHISNISIWIAGWVKTELFSLQYWSMRSSVSHSLNAIQEARKTYSVRVIP